MKDIKSKDIKTEKVVMVAIDFPDGFKAFAPEGTYKSIGSAHEVTEEQWKGIVEQIGVDEWDVFVNYVDERCAFETATESGLSLLKANGVVLENEFGEEPKLSDYVFEEHPELVGNPKEYDQDKFDSDYQEWQKCQEQVWSNCQLFIKL